MRIDVQGRVFLMQLARGGLRACSAGVLTVQQDEQREHTRPCFKTGNNMIRGILDAIAGVVRIASSAERHEVSLFVLDDESDQPATNVRSPTHAGWAAASGVIETKIACRTF
jgi:hypothetical protein